ncbi:unknown [Firmicutes bacterium CAG:884]|nr:unknown [Firmicutes bacterium CAG:884]
MFFKLLNAKINDKIKETVITKYVKLTPIPIGYITFFIILKLIGKTTAPNEHIINAIAIKILFILNIFFSETEYVYLKNSVAHNIK